MAGYGWILLQTLAALGLVCLLAIVVFRLLVPRALRGRSGPVRVVGRVAVDPKRSLLLVEAAGRCFLIGSSEGGLQLIAELDPAQVAAAREAEKP
jgi:flagellar protein FliO/FliZ